MLGNFGKKVVKIFGSRSERLVKTYMTVARKAGEFEEQIKQLTDEQLKAKTAEFKDRHQRWPQAGGNFARGVCGRP